MVGLLRFHGRADYFRREVVKLQLLEGSAISPQLQRCYQDQAIRERMLEFLGAAVYVAASDGASGGPEVAHPSHLSTYLNACLEVDRSMWDRESLLVHLDLENHNFDHPTSPLLDPERAFRLQQPVLDATLQVLGNYGIV